MERRMIEEALAATGGHQQKAAARLGISRRTLSRKLKLYESEQRVAL
jgi:DNA-binding NtrC family response regulator